MKLACAAGLLFAVSLTAHPPVGIVISPAGDVYYSDLKQVFKIGKDGKPVAVVAGVHTHELALDAAGNLFGEHLWYEGDRTGKWAYRVWQLSAGGRLSDVIPARQGFRTDYSFIRDLAGNMYWSAGDTPDAPKRTHVKVRSNNGTIRALTGPVFQNIREISAAPDGTVYVVDHTGSPVDGHTLSRVTAKGVERLARKLSTRVDEEHAVMGLSAGAGGSVYVAVYADRVVKKISAKGDVVSVVAKSAQPWAPTGVAAAGNGELWVLETNVSNDVRARKVKAW